MPSNNIVFVAYQDQPNLGIGYIASVLDQNGFDVEVLDFRMGFQAILERIQLLDPLVIGLSIIFQYYTVDFARLVTYLRDHGVKCIICAGGHYPSLEPEQTFRMIPYLDLIVRFEGEFTFLEIVRRLSEGRDWRQVQSISYLEDTGLLVSTPLRSLIPDLDCLPFPRRWGHVYHCLGIRVTSILASRGCPRACSFCSIRRFYSIPPGHIRRTRSPGNVIEEMLQLYHDHNVRVFLFQDDDFSLMSKRDREWSWRFVHLLNETELRGSIIWKISCRADEVESEIFRAFRDAGLYLVYLGIESGNDTGLKTLNKHISMRQNLEAVETLKSLGIQYDFGFMLFDPTSTIDLVLENVQFLRRICGDGSATASFGKTLAYAGTDLEQQMRSEGRLRGDVQNPDYDFLDRLTEEWFSYLSNVFYPWVYGGQSIQSQLRWALLEIDILESFYSSTPGIEDHKKKIKYLVHWYNEIFCRIVEDSCLYFRSAYARKTDALQSIHRASETQRHWLENELGRQRQLFFTAAEFPLDLVIGESDTSA